MPFALKNTDATYQWRKKKCFHDQILCNIEVYVYDIVVKSKKAGQFIADLEETFTNLRWFNIKVNPRKYVVGSRRESNSNPSSLSMALRPTQRKFQQS